MLRNDLLRGPTWFAQRQKHPLKSFFCEPPVYVVVAPQSPECTCVVYDRTDGGPAIRGFLSLFDADLAAYWMIRLGGRFYGQRTSLIDPSHFRAPEGAGFALNLHVGWVARDHQVLLGLGGEPMSVCRPLFVHDWATTFDVDDCTMKLLGAMYEAAGLFAWREMLDELENREDGQLKWAHARVRRSLFEGGRWTLHERGGFDSGGGYCESWDQLALFDPESGQWHFVPRDVMTGGVI